MSEPSSDSGLKGPAGVTPHAGPGPAPSTPAPSPAAAQPGNGHQPFGAALAPVLQQACDGKLSNVAWFRADWQRGGALTGYSTFSTDAGPIPVVVKLPVPPVELHWLERLQAAADVVPRLYALGQTLGGYDIAWAVMERLPHGPLGSAWGGQEFDLLVEAAGRFYAAAGPFEGVASERRDWAAIAELSRRTLLEQSLPETPRWKDALKKAHKKLPLWLERWNSRPRRDVCHGDLHLGNAMTRLPPPQGPAILLDFGEAHGGHWVEDAVYLEHIYWGSPQRLGPHKPPRDLAQQRKKLGLPVDPDWAEFATIKRNLLALAAPADFRHSPPRHLTAALQILESQLH